MRWPRLKFRERDLDRELRADLELEAAERQADGLSPEEAYYAARRALGNLSLVKEDVREMWGWNTIERLKQDIVYAFRGMRRSPAFALTAVLSLALGIGANTAIFSIVDAVLLRPLPYRQPGRLAMLWEQGAKDDENFVSPADFRDWRAQSRSFESLAALIHTSFSITGGNSPERVAGELISPELFPVLGAAPALGRGFVAADERQVPYVTVILSYGLWQRRFGGDPGAIGKALESNGRKLTIVGVMPKDFDFPSGLIRTPPELWVPLARPPEEWAVRGFHYLRVIGRLREGVPLAAAGSEMSAIQKRIAAQNPEDAPFGAVRVATLANEISGDVRTPLLVVFAAVFFVLLIACVNVANLILARSSARQREFAVRLALGAGRARLIRQLSTESLLLGMLGGGLGIALAAAMTRGIVAMAPANVPRLSGVRMDSQVLLFTLAVSLLAGVLSGIAPAFGFSARRVSEQLQAGGRGASQASGGGLRSVLVASEIALAIVLVAGAGLMAKSLYRLEQVRPGFRTENILSFFVTLPDAKYSAERRPVFFGDLIERIRRIPGVESAGATTALPLSGTDDAYTFEIEGRPRAAGQPMTGAHYRVVSPDYFLTLGIPLLRGRMFSARDTAASVRTAVINDSLARKYFPGEDPVGKRITIGNGRNTGPSEVIGVIKDVNHFSLAARPTAEMYETYLQTPQSAMTLTVRAAGDPHTLLPAIRRELASLDRDVPLSKVLTMSDLMDDSLAPSRFRGTLLAGFALSAMILAAMGVYGVMAYTLSRRTSEIGIRVALGAQPSQVLELMLGRALRLSVTGVAIGLGAALWLTRFFKGLLFEVAPGDPLTFGAAALILTGAAMAASYIPARRAMKVDPMTALRHE
jgi:putative ABC transport system permease protein